MMRPPQVEKRTYSTDSIELAEDGDFDLTLEARFTPGGSPDVVLIHLDPKDAINHHPIENAALLTTVEARELAYWLLNAIDPAWQHTDPGDISIHLRDLDELDAELED